MLGDAQHLIITLSLQRKWELLLVLVSPPLRVFDRNWYTLSSSDYFFLGVCQPVFDRLHLTRTFPLFTTVACLPVLLDNYTYKYWTSQALSHRWEGERNIQSIPYQNSNPIVRCSRAALILIPGHCFWIAFGVRAIEAEINPSH